MGYLEILKQAARGPAQEAKPETERNPQDRPADDLRKSGTKTPAAVSLETHGPEANTTPDLPESVLASRYPLAALARLALDSLPAAGKLSPQERRIILDALEVVVLNWLRTVSQPQSAWKATCPKGHLVADGIFVKALVGWCCEQCEQVYPSRDCKLRINSSEK